jgi:hypothetical protein
MKRAVKYLFTAFVALLYVAAYMGFGIHRCNAEHTASFVLMAGDLSCEAIHVHAGHHHDGDHHDHHDGCDEDCDCHHVPGCFHFHSSKCCTTDFYSVTDAQDSDDFSSDRLFQQVTLIACAPHNIPDTFGSDAATDFRSKGIPIAAGVPEAFLGVWRL